jgi:DNA polymerase elongation subunit (family B)
MSKKPFSFKCIDINASDYTDENFQIQIYGIDEHRKTYSIFIDNFKPFFYIKVGSNWTTETMKDFFEFIKETNKNDKYLIKAIDEEIHELKLVKKKTLYNFDANKYYKFIYVSCHSISFFYKIKKFYYDSKKQILTEGIEFNGTITKLYEIMIPPMLRFLHIQQISPSGWIEIKKYEKISQKHKNTTCDYEFNVKYENIISLEHKEVAVPYKICSFDIEASSSHGDFPSAKKNYKKVAYDIIEYINKNEDIVEEMGIEFTLKNILLNVFGFKEDMNIDLCILKQTYFIEKFNNDFNKFYNYDFVLPEKDELENCLKNYFDNTFEEQDKESASDDINDTSIDVNDININPNEKEKHKKDKKKKENKKEKKYNISLILTNDKFDNQEKMLYILYALNKHFPEIEGDYVTFIGSTFVMDGVEKSYLNHCICLKDTANIEPETQNIECYDTEKEVLIAWTKLIQKEDPDIIIGYNIFGFDYPFLYDRACENNCQYEFLKLGRNKYKHKDNLNETSTILASGAYELKYPEMYGRLQIDVYTYMRKEFQLPSYKLDYISSYLISDSIIKYENNIENETCRIYTKNMKGITLNCFIHLEIVSHSNDEYMGGKKFKVIDILKDGFIIEGVLYDLEHKQIQWGLAKDDVSPQDIFRMTKNGPQDKGIIAKYCIQDCNLVHQIFQKIDILTTYIEMSKICSVPISFLMLRGQGIKLTSYIAKKCREKDTLMPLISKGKSTDAYEGAIVLDPKCNLYLDNPVACVDYSSLYPSSIISENISHDSKVWTKTYDLDGNLINKSGIICKNGDFKYDNLPNYKYVDIKYDTFKYIRKHPKAAAKKVLTGYKVCRYAQFPEDEKAIMPSILQELLSARKATKKQMAKENDPFMKNILDKRQLSIKVTANSLYGQTGAKTSSFYEMDVAASTTATGRKLLIYAKELIENVYKNLEIETKYGNMITNAEYIYGDTDSVFFTFNLKDKHTGETVVGQKALEVTIEYAKKAGHLATQFLKKPHDLEYEKTFMPFCLLSKKRYVGMLYEENPHKCKCKSMGIVLKRRDNAPIVKDVYGGIIDILMKDKNIDKSIEFLNKMLDNIVNKNININKLIISKSLRSFYKNPDKIAHKVLADRMGVRDPGNKPGPGDRIPYVYILNNNKKDLQGNRIETPDYIIQNNIKIDYGFYITNQIMKPVIQIYSLILMDMPQFKRKKNHFMNKIKTLETNTEEYDKFIEKKQKLKDKEVENLLFSKYLRICNNNKNGNSMITNYFTPLNI